MENASKALIIAGAILLAILLISLGLIVFRNASGTINNANLNKEEIQAFNYQFEKYIGENKSGTEVRALLQLVAANNNAEDDSDRRIAVEAAASVLGNSSAKLTGVLTSVPSSVSSSQRYKVSASYEHGGLIDTITITKASSGSDGE